MTALRSAFGDSARLPAGVGAWMSTRSGGCSAAPYDGLNLGDHVGDEPAHVQANRALLARTLGAEPVFMQQVHGQAVVGLHSAHAPTPMADACWSEQPGLACTVLVADCLPVLLWDVQARWVAAAHAGWRGLAGEAGVGVLEALWQALQRRGARAAETRVWLGPCIGPQAFEVGPEVRTAFGADGPAVAAAFRPGPGDRLLADLPALARWRLQCMDLVQIGGNDGTPAHCTVTQSALFFSHRRDTLRLGGSGRMAACIWLDRR